MTTARLTEEQITGIVQKHRRGVCHGATCAALCRKQGMSEDTFYIWKAKYSYSLHFSGLRP